MGSFQELGTDQLLAAAAPVETYLSALAKKTSNPVRAAVLYLAAHFRDETLTIDEMAKASHLDCGSARMRFREQVGVPPRELLENCRLEMVIHLFTLMPDLTVENVAHAVGYSSAKTLHGVSKRRIGATPSRVRAIIGKLKSPELNLSGVKMALCREATELPKPGESENGAEIDRAAVDRAFFEKILRGLLKQAPESEGRRLIRNGFRFRTCEIVTGLLRMSREEARDDRALGMRLAERALTALWSLKYEISPERWQSLRVDALAHLGNAECLARDWQAAERSFTEATLALEGAIDVASDARANLLAFKGFFRSCQERLREGEILLADASSIRRELGEPAPLVQTLLAYGWTKELQGEPGDAIRHYREAADLVECIAEPDAYLVLAVHNHLARALILVGELDLANTHLEIAQQQAEVVGSSQVRCRLSWLAGLLALARRQVESAGRHLELVREEFEEVGDLPNASLVSIDLGIVRLQQGRLAEACGLAIAALPALKALTLSDKTLTALRVLEESAQKQNLTRAVLETLRQQVGPALEAPSVQVG